MKYSCLEKVRAEIWNFGSITNPNQPWKREKIKIEFDFWCKEKKNNWIIYSFFSIIRFI